MAENTQELKQNLQLVLNPACCSLNEDNDTMSTRVFIYALRKLRKGRPVQLLVRYGGSDERNVVQTIAREFEMMLKGMVVPNEHYAVVITDLGCLDAYHSLRIDVSQAP